MKVEKCSVTTQVKPTQRPVVGYLKLKLTSANILFTFNFADYRLYTSGCFMLFRTKLDFTFDANVNVNMLVMEIHCQETTLC